MSQFDVKFFKPFIDGTLNTLKVQCSLEAVPEKPYIKGSQSQSDYDIAAVIGLTSNAFSGTITLCFVQSTFLGIMSSLLGERYSYITDELEDGAAELLNIIFGQAKATLAMQGYTIEKAIPTVVRGVGLRTKHMPNLQAIVLPFKTPVGTFDVEIVAEAKSL